MVEPADNAVVVLDDVWKRYPPAREPHPLSRILARLGGVELDGGIPMDDLDEDDEFEEEFEEEPAQSEGAALDALRGVSLSIEAGACLGLVGPTGAGKSVLLRLIAGLAPPTAGRVVVRGTVAPALTSIARLVPARLGVPKTILALAMMTRLSRSDAKRRLPEIFELAGLPNAGVPGTSLTPPQMRRILLAMMLSVEADVVLVDVPLEPGRSHDRFVERIHERNQAGATIVIAAENEDELAGLAEQFVYLEDGRIVHDDGETETVAGARESLRGIDDADSAPSSPDRPLSPDAERYLEYIRLLIGDRRADKAYALAAAKTHSGPRVEWTALAQAAGFGYVEHRGIIDRLRKAHGVEDDEPIHGPQAGRNDLPLSPDARRYLDYIRVLVGDERADEALRNALATPPEHATQVEWTWLARWAGFAYPKQVNLIERLRARDGVDMSEPIFGAREARRKAGD